MGIPWLLAWLLYHPSFMSAMHKVPCEEKRQRHWNRWDLFSLHFKHLPPPPNKMYVTCLTKSLNNMQVIKNSLKSSWRIDPTLDPLVTMISRCRIDLDYIDYHLALQSCWYIRTHHGRKMPSSSLIPQLLIYHLRVALIMRIGGRGKQLVLRIKIFFAELKVNLLIFRFYNYWAK